MNIKASVIEKIMNTPKQITCRYNNDEIETMIRSRYEEYGYKRIASNFAFDIKRLQEEGVSQDNTYDLYLEIYTERYYDEGKLYYYHFHIGRPYKKEIQELFPITNNPSLETTIAYKTILETCVYLIKQINPTDGVFHAEVKVAPYSDIVRILSSEYSKRVDKDLYLVDSVKVSNSSYLLAPYRRFMYAHMGILMVL